MCLNDNLVANRINGLIELDLNEFLAARLAAIKLKFRTSEYNLPIFRKYIEGFAQFSNGQVFNICTSQLNRIGMTT